MDNRPHGLQTGQSVVFREVNGMEELNGTVQHVSGIINHLFHAFKYLRLYPSSVCDASKNINHRDEGEKTLITY